MNRYISDAYIVIEEGKSKVKKACNYADLAWRDLLHNLSQ